MPPTGTISIFTIDLYRNGEFQKYHKEDQIKRCSKTEADSNVSKITDEPITSDDSTETAFTIHTDTSLQDEASSSTSEEGEYSSTSGSSLVPRSSPQTPSPPSSEEHGHCSMVMSSSTSDDSPQCSSLPTHSICQICTDNLVSTQITLDEHSATLVSDSTTGASQQDSTKLITIEDDATTHNEQCRLTVAPSTAEICAPFLFLSPENLEQSITSPQYESFVGSMANKSSESIPESMIGPPPLYVPTFRYEPPGFYEPPPPYTSFSLDSFAVDEISHIGSQERQDNERNNHFRIELIRFTIIAFSIILAIYLVGLMRQK